MIRTTTDNDNALGRVSDVGEVLCCLSEILLPLKRSWSTRVLALQARSCDEVVVGFVDGSFGRGDCGSLGRAVDRLN
jgi:hypothetical protein